MATLAASVTAGDVMDRAAVLMNDPSQTDYTYAVLTPFLNMALDELSEILQDSQSSPMINSDVTPIILQIGENALYNPSRPSGPYYPYILTEVQEVSERLAGSQDVFVPLRRLEFIETAPPSNMLGYWAWEAQVIKFNPKGATTVREIQLKYIRDASNNIVEPNMIVGPFNSRSFLSYKTAAYAAQFIGENPERASLLDAKAQQAMERLESIANKGRQQIMTRHRPFRANWKMRGGY